MSESQTKLRRKLRAALEADGAKMWHDGYRAGYAAGWAKGWQDGWEGCQTAIREGALTLITNDSSLEARTSGENK